MRWFAAAPSRVLGWSPPLETCRRCGVALPIISPCPTGTDPEQAVVEVLKACAACRVVRRLGSNAEGLDDLSVWEAPESLW
jgi:hypothetical protein